jgi:hypothetical protein
METGWGLDSRTAPDWLQCPNRQPWPRVGWWSPVDVVFYGPFEQAAGGGFEAAENSFLELVGHRLKQTSLTDVDRRLSAVEELPARIVVGADEQAPATRTHVRLAIDICPRASLRSDQHTSAKPVRQKSASACCLTSSAAKSSTTPPPACTD